jgi:peptidoglycan/xylan/chitin deacetylase (PgdA/CDA1 family)
MRFGAILLGLILPVIPARPAKAQNPTQYVIVSFDGDLHNEQWVRSRTLARQTGAHFTYFLSCVYLLTPETRTAYKGPGMARGRSNVGSGFSREDVAERLGNIWAAHSEGHEIASHACGHFDGKSWSRQDWLEEFDQFRTIMRDAWSVNGIAGEPQGWPDFVEHSIEGFRAPYLSTSDALYAALAQEGFIYDASSVSRGPVRPSNEGGVMRFSLPLIPEGPKRREVIAMDYNLFVRHSKGEEKPEKALRFADRAYAAFRAAFDRQYRSERIPLQLGFHFTLMNGGAYWKALDRFARDVCVMPDVRCVSYREYIEDTRQHDRQLLPIGG